MLFRSGMEPDDKGRQVIYAEATQSETFKYAIDLRSMTHKYIWE